MTHDDFFQNGQVKRLITELDAGRRNKRLLYQNEGPSKFYKQFCDSFKAVTGQTEEYLLNVIQNEYENVYVYTDRSLSGAQSYIDVLRKVMQYAIIKYFPDKLESFLLTVSPDIYQDKPDFLAKGVALIRSEYTAEGRTFVLKDDKQDKFWSIALLSGGSVVITEGKTGTLGQSRSLYLGNEAAANKEVEKSIAAKLKKGYIEV